MAYFRKPFFTLIAKRNKQYQYKLPFIQWNTLSDLFIGTGSPGMVFTNHSWCTFCQEIVFEPANIISYYNTNKEWKWLVVFDFILKLWWTLNIEIPEINIWRSMAHGKVWYLFVFFYLFFLLQPLSYICSYTSSVTSILSSLVWKKLRRCWYIPLTVQIASRVCWEECLLRLLKNKFVWR